MKKALLKDSLKEIKNTYKRFISILLMAFLGVGFFAGIRATSPDMLDTINNYYNSQNVYDIQVLSTLGLTNEDLLRISQINSVDRVIGTYETDGKIEIEEKEAIVKFIAIQDVNKPLLLNGRLPKKSDECVVEETFLVNNNMSIGDTIDANIADTKNDDGDNISYLKNNKLKIVGTVQSPLYISKDKGTSKLGSGKVNYYVYILEDNVNANDIFTNIYIRVKDSKKYLTSSSEYEDLVEVTKEQVENIKSECEKNRYDKLVEKATSKINDAKKELEKQENEARDKINEAESKINDGYEQIKNSSNEILKNEKNANSKFSDAQNKIDVAWSQINQNEKNLSKSEEEAYAKFAELETKKEYLNEKIKELEKQENELNSNYIIINNMLLKDNLSDKEKENFLTQKAEIEYNLSKISETKKELQNSICTIDEGIESSKNKILNGKNEINQAKVNLQNSQTELDNSKKVTYSKLSDAKYQIESSKKELENAKIELENQKIEFEQKISDAKLKLSDAEEKISDIEYPKWYILTRNENAGYVSFIQDTKSIENIGKVFPVVFFVVATLISLTSMTRMVEEQRMQIGTLKALGYSKIQIMQKYVLYAAIACITGSLIGMSVGFVILPKIIWLMYGMMYQITPISISFNLKYGGIGLLLICVCMIGATIYAVMKELISTPAVLMRPKAPKGGNRVLLEKINFIWKRLNFSQKVTIRNLFRYKKRFYMTIVGILGCCALILTGFGVKDSVLQIIPNQFGRIFTYDMQISIKSDISKEDKEKLVSYLENKKEFLKICKSYMTSGIISNGELSEDLQILVPDSLDSFDGIINVNDVKTKESLKLDYGKVYVSDKVAQLIGAKVGDEVKLKNSNDVEVTIKISNIVENYVSHYVFMSKETYHELFNEEFDLNNVFTKNKKLSDEENEELLKELTSNSSIGSAIDINSSVKSINDMMSLLNYVVIILIISAGLLAFVVLYNLANVNISERIRELATIKVLGFYDKEVYQYVTRETVILTLIGIALGLVGGYFLNYYIMGTCEINMLRFTKTINVMSYVYAALITIAFTLIVNIATYFSLKKIDMIESLKSVE